MQEVVELQPGPIDWYVKRLGLGLPTSFSRWGDGEWRSVLAENDACWERLRSITPAWRKGKTNKSGHSFPTKMGEEMRAMLRSRPKHILLLANRYGNPKSPMPQIGLARWIKEWLTANGLDDLPWGPADTIVRALYRMEFEPFMDVLQDKRILLVGPGHLKGLDVIPVDEFIGIPPRDAYKAIDTLFKQINHYCEKAGEPVTVSISMGPASPLLIERLTRECPSHSFMDLGSIWDGFVGQHSRSYMKVDDVRRYTEKLKKKYGGAG